MVKLLEALRISAEQVRLEINRSGLFEHKGERGEYRERIVQEFLRPYLPECYGLGRGEVFSANGESSRQIDIVIYDAIFSSVLMKDEKSQLFPCESVFGSIEVKTELTGETLEQGVENIVSLKRLDREASDMLDILPFRRINVGDTLTYGTAKRNHYLGVIFAYRGLRFHRVVEYLEEQSNDPEKRMMLPDFVFNLERGYVVLRCETIEGRKIARFFGQDYDGYGQIILGEYTLPLFYLTVNTFLNKSILKAPDWGRYWLQAVEIAGEMTLQNTATR